MLCELYTHFLINWAAMSALALVMMMLMSGSLFYVSYHNPSYTMWRTKSNPIYPPPSTVRSEIIQMLKGLVAATLCPALSLWLSQHGHSQAYCGMDGHSVSYHILTFFAIWLGTDFWSFYYHRLGHTYDFFWNQHRHHHKNRLRN